MRAEFSNAGKPTFILRYVYGRYDSDASKPATGVPTSPLPSKNAGASKNGGDIVGLYVGYSNSGNNAALDFIVLKVLPLVAATPKHSDCLQKKKNELERIEHKLDAGLDR